MKKITVSDLYEGCVVLVEISPACQSIDLLTGRKVSLKAISRLLKVARVAPADDRYYQTCPNAGERYRVDFISPDAAITINPRTGLPRYGRTLFLPAEEVLEMPTV